MNLSNKTKDKDSRSIENFTILGTGTFNIIYYILHLLLGFFAIYLSFRCNDYQFHLGEFLFACCCPHAYIIYKFAFYGGCGILETS